MGRLGVRLREQQQTVFMGHATKKRVEITLPRIATKEMHKRLEKEPEAFSPHIEAARDFIRDQRGFNLDIWFPWQNSLRQNQSAKLFGARFKNISLWETMERQK